jgi:phosphoglycolate phosphatase-like HAD superfamily hydrolase
MNIDKNTQTIVWDLDGTILDSFRIYKECLSRVFVQNNLLEPPEIVLRQNHHGTLDETIHDVLSDLGHDTSKHYVDKLLQQFLEIDVEYLENPDDNLFTDAINLISRLHTAGKSQIVVTNRTHGIDRQNASPRTLINNSLVRGMLDDIICSDEVKVRKPSRAALSEKYGEDLRELGPIVVIGDQFVDAQFARNLGGRAVLVQRTDTLHHMQSIENWQSFVDVVPSLNDVLLA